MEARLACEPRAAMAVQTNERKKQKKISRFIVKITNIRQDETKEPNY